MITKKLFICLFLLGLAFFMTTPPLANAFVYPQRPSGSPYVPWQILRDTFYNTSYYLQNLEDPNIVAYVAAGFNGITPNTGSAINIYGLACQHPCSLAQISAVGILFTVPALQAGSDSWGLSSLVFDNLFGSPANPPFSAFNGRLVAHVYTVSSGLPFSNIAFSNTLRMSDTGFGAADNVIYSTWNFTFSPLGTTSLYPNIQYFADLELRDDISSGSSNGATVTCHTGNPGGIIYTSGAWHSFSCGFDLVLGVFPQKHYTVIKEYPGFPTRFDSIHDDATPDMVNHITAQTVALHETGMLRNISCSGTRQYSGDYGPRTTGGPAPDGGAFDSYIGNVLEDQIWTGNGYDDCPTSTWTEPGITDSSFSPNGDSRLTICTGPGPGVNTIGCSFNWEYSMSSSVTSRADNIFLGNHQQLSLGPTSSGNYFGPPYSQSVYQSFRYSVRHAQQMGNKFYGYVLGPLLGGFTARGQSIQNLVNDFGFTSDIYDPMFNADYNLPDGYLSDGSITGPYHDCYVYNQLPGHSDQAGSIGLDYYPYRSAVCSQMPTSLATYLCYATGCAPPFTQPDALYLSLHAKHIMDKYASAQIATAEADMNNICWDGKGICLGTGLTAYSTVRHATYLSALVKLEELLGTTTSYVLSGHGCESSRGGGTVFSCSITQRIQDVANILWKLQIGAGPWSVDYTACGSLLPGAFEDQNTNAISCAPDQIGGFVVGYVPGDAPFAFKNPRSGLITLTEDFYCGIVLNGSGCINMDSETPYATPANTESTIVSMMALLDYYKLVYPGDIDLNGRVDIVDVATCAASFGTSNGGLGNQPLVIFGYNYMCDSSDTGHNDIVGVATAAAYMGADYSRWNYVVNGDLELGNLFGWNCTPSCSEARVVLNSKAFPSSPSYGAYALNLSDSVNSLTTVSQITLNPSTIYGAFVSSFNFYLPNLPELNAQNSYPTLFFGVGPKYGAGLAYGAYVIGIQPSSVLLGGTLQDCVEMVAYGTVLRVQCFPVTSFPHPIFLRNAWSTGIQITKGANGIVEFYPYPGSGVSVSFNDPGTVAERLDISVQHCSTILAEQVGHPTQLSCSGTTPDYYYVDQFSLMGV